MAYDIFMKLDDIPGESTDDKHKEWINLLAFSMGVSQMAVDRSAGSAGGTSRADFQNLAATHRFDKASPKLFEFCATGKHIPTVLVQLHRATGDKQKYLEYKLTDVVITSVAPAGDGSSDVVPLESFSLDYGKIEITYTATDNKGTAKGDVKAGWDRVANKKV